LISPTSVNFDDWTESADGAIDQDDTDPFTGTYCAKLTADADHEANPCYLEQDITSIVGITYTLSGYVKGDYKVSLTGDSNTDNDSDTAADWTPVSVDIVADDTTITARLEPADDDDIAYFDAFTLTATYPANHEFTKFVGTMARITPTSGLFDRPVTDCEAWDWIGYMNNQELGIQAIQSDKRVDEVLPTLISEFPNAPEATDYDTGVETFELVFAGDSDASSMASQFAKLCRNEQGRIFVKGDGTLRFEAQGQRAANTTSDFTLDGTMANIQVSYAVSNIYNIITLDVRTTETDATATTEIFTVGKGILIPAGETITLTCNYTDPDTGREIGASDVVDPETADDFHFGSTRTPASDDMHADLSFVTSPVIGGSSLSVELENTSGSDGYLNELTILGKRIKEYSSFSITKSDADSILQVGNRKYSNRLDLIEDAETAEDIVDALLAKYAPSHIDKCVVTVPANIDDDLATQFILAEPSTRFTAIESVTGIEKDFYINRIKYRQQDTLLWCTIEAEEA